MPLLALFGELWLRKLCLVDNWVPPACIHFSCQTAIIQLIPDIGKNLSINGRVQFILPNKAQHTLLYRRLNNAMQSRTDFNKLESHSRKMGMECFTFITNRHLNFTQVVFVSQFIPLPLEILKMQSSYVKCQFYKLKKKPHKKLTPIFFYSTVYLLDF